jgi:hypothetical protein
MLSFWSSHRSNCSWWQSHCVTLNNIHKLKELWVGITLSKTSFLSLIHVSHIWQNTYGEYFFLMRLKFYIRSKYYSSLHTSWNADAPNHEPNGTLCLS